MRETPEELQQLQALLDTSLAGSTAHLRSIISSERTLTAEQLTGALTGMCTLALSTVTAKGEPRISGVDGHFLHGKWHFGTARSAAKARHLAARPAVSAAHLRGEDLGVFTHGTAEILNPLGGEPAADWPELLAYFRDFYGDDAFDWDDDVVYYRLHPHWMAVFAADPAKLGRQADDADTADEVDPADEANKADQVDQA
ncbi:pyridoxamine 5'-phosphate oxidase [Streptomyces sp. 1114.5]|uniref:pyridoxamine 5'-phosphate oxidase family protein n=1 Tax=Streptomyces sp. 1114.5 TaxID=1938830 RepID=UPI000EAE36BE|nr:pyridoxamine 5'-phosphate oxidase family protein [Streptomyces sp. 1114.5]RKT09729.1 pyridoxamine 5'-phosphate oxidase [Streptomyces sp. 1114.5]